MLFLQQLRAHCRPPWSVAQVPSGCAFSLTFLSSLSVLFVSSHFSRVLLCATLWTVAHQAPLCMGFSRQEYRSGLPCPPLGGLPHPGMEPASLPSPALTGGLFTTGVTWDGRGRIEAHILPSILTPFQPVQSHHSGVFLPDTEAGLPFWVSLKGAVERPGHPAH